MRFTKKEMKALLWCASFVYAENAYQHALLDSDILAMALAQSSKAIAAQGIEDTGLKAPELLALIQRMGSELEL